MCLIQCNYFAIPVEYNGFALSIADDVGLPCDVDTLASFTMEVDPRLAKRPLVPNGRLAKRELTSLIVVTGIWIWICL